MNINLIQTFNGGGRIFRDDIYPFLGGGNKGRKMDSIAKHILLKQADAVVTTGGIQSNHCRAVAVFAAQNKMRCTLVLHGNKSQFYKESGNATIMRFTGSEIVFVNQPKEIGLAMDKAMSDYKSSGYNPYYIYGGGHTTEGGKAYIDAILELKEYCDAKKWCPEHIFLASGTGSTQGGILAGLDKYGIDSKVIGISVGRKSPVAAEVVSSFYKDICSHYSIINQNREIKVLDEYLCGGYALFNDAIESISNNSLKDHGFILDTCYTAKAFYGMQDYIVKNKINRNDILFWHTGGIFNFLA